VALSAEAAPIVPPPRLAGPETTPVASPRSEALDDGDDFGEARRARALRRHDGRRIAAARRAREAAARRWAEREAALARAARRYAPVELGEGPPPVLCRSIACSAYVVLGVGF